MKNFYAGLIKDKFSDKIFVKWENKVFPNNLVLFFFLNGGNMQNISPQENLQRVLDDFETEMQYLISNKVLTNVDAQKIRGQVTVTKNAMITTREESSFNDRAKEKLLNALIRDFEKSIQRFLDEAVSRKGDKALLVFKISRADRKIIQQTKNLNFSQNDLAKLQAGAEMLKFYITRSLSYEKKSVWSSPKINVNQIVINYEETIIEYIKNSFPNVKTLI